MQASEARRKVGKSAEMRVGTLQGASVRAIPTNNPTKNKIKKKNKKNHKKQKLVFPIPQLKCNLHPVLSLR